MPKRRLSDADRKVGAELNMNFGGSMAESVQGKSEELNGKPVEEPDRPKAVRGIKKTKGAT